MLRTRLTLGLLLLLALLLFMGFYSIYKDRELGRRMQGVEQSTDEAEHGLEKMKGSSSAMTAALLGRLAQDDPQSAADFAAASRAFEQALAREQAGQGRNAEEVAAAGRLAETYRLYQRRAQIYFREQSVPPDPALRDTANHLGECTSKLSGQIDQLRLAHEHALVTGGLADAKDLGGAWWFPGLLMTIGFVATALAWMGLNLGLLQPLRSLTVSIRQIGEGNLDQKVPVQDNHELGELAESFNQMAAQLKEYRTSASVELMRLNTTIRATLASFPDPIFVLNSEGAVDFRNPEADQLAVKLLFSGVTRLPSKVDEHVERVRASGQDYLPTLFKDAIKFHLSGQDRYFLPRIVLLRDGKRITFGVAVILEDVTRMLLLDDVKSNLISTVSHELKTPLTSVRMALYLLVEKTVGALNDKQMDLVVTAREDADRLLHTLNDLLDLAKLEHGSSPLELARTAPGELVTNAIHSARETAQAGGTVLEMAIAPDLPEVEVDRQRIAYVFANLITNAIKYSAAGASVLVGARSGENRSGRPSVHFFVADNGPGISPDHQDHLFDRFYRVPGTNKTGAGLGLSIAREIVTAHHGEIGVISTPGEGSEFFFVLPFRSESAA